MSRYVINVFASQDLNEIADYFADNSLEAGNGSFVALTVSVSSLLHFPAAAKTTQPSALDCDACPWKDIESLAEF